MTSKKSLYILISALALLAFATVGCERSYEEIDESQATPTIAEGESEFPVTLPSDMEGVFEAGAQTSTAIAVASGVPAVDVATMPAEETAVPAEAEPATQVPPAGATAINTLPVMATNTALPPTSTGPKPATYMLQQGEFPYCIARRFNVNPDELLALNGLTSAQARIYEPGLTLSIPSSGAAFPATRALNAHPISYTTSQNMTVYGIACYFGDIDPTDIINGNNIPDLYNIPAGTTLQIP